MLDACKVVKSLPEDRWLHHGRYFKVGGQVCIVGCLMEAAGLFNKYDYGGGMGGRGDIPGIAHDLSQAYDIPISKCTLHQWIIVNDADISNLAIMQELICDYALKVKSYE